MPQPATQYPKTRFSTPPRGVGKLAYQGATVERLHPWMRPTPLIIQRRAHAAEHARTIEGLVRVSILLAADLLILFVAHALVDLARTSQSLGGIVSSFLSEVIPRGTFPRVEVLTAVIIGLAIFGNYRGRSRWHNVATLVAGSSLGLSLVFWSRIWSGITLQRVFGFVFVLAAVFLALAAGRQLLRYVVNRVRPQPIKISRALILGSPDCAETLKQSDGIRLNEHLSIVGQVSLDHQLAEDSLGK